MDKTQSGPLSFEEAYERLEQILGRLNRGETPLEESLQLYEEAHRLITSCSLKLDQAEQRIEMLIKNREGAPQRVPFTSPADFSEKAFAEKVFETSHDPTT